MAKAAPAYFLFDVRIHDSSQLGPYLDGVEATYKAYGGKLLTLHGQQQVVEGQGPMGAVVILTFESLDMAQAWHASEAYQQLIPYRHAAADTNAWLIEGLAG